MVHVRRRHRYQRFVQVRDRKGTFTREFPNILGTTIRGDPPRNKV